MFGLLYLKEAYSKCRNILKIQIIVEESRFAQLWKVFMNCSVTVTRIFENFGALFLHLWYVESYNHSSLCTLCLTKRHWVLVVVLTVYEVEDLVSVLFSADTILDLKADSVWLSWLFRLIGPVVFREFLFSLASS